MKRTVTMPVRRSRIAIVTVCAGLALTACGLLPEEVTAEGTLAPPDQSTSAFTYDPALAPVGATITVNASKSADATAVEITVEGLLPNRGYAVHAHARACGPTGADAGPHYQHQTDPAATAEKPSSDPAFANPANEIWLDLRTDGQGSATVRSDVPFAFADRSPASVVIHEAEATKTAPGEAGTAGARVACLNVPFASSAS